MSNKTRLSKHLNENESNGKSLTIWDPKICTKENDNNLKSCQSSLKTDFKMCILV